MTSSFLSSIETMVENRGECLEKNSTDLDLPENDGAVISPSVSTESDPLRSFIETFETLEILWNNNSEHYKNKTKRNAAIKKLIPIYQKIKPGATAFDVKRKINTLRCNYRKELKKIEDSKRSGAGADQIYKPFYHGFSMHFGSYSSLSSP